MIFGKRRSIRGLLVLKSDLHIGGSDPQIDASGREFTPAVRYVDGRPFIPASSLKGVLRSALSEVVSNALMGEGSEHETGRGNAANFWLDHSVMKAPSTRNLNDLSEQPVSDGVFRKKSLAVDQHSGAAEDNKLFDREWIASGAKFDFSAEYFGEDVEALQNILSSLYNGVSLGAQTSKGNGQIALDKTSLKIDDWASDNAGNLVPTPLKDLAPLNEEPAQPSKSNGVSVVLQLDCEGPYLSVKSVGGDANGNEFQPLQENGKPVLWASSFVGALRSEARYLAALEKELSAGGERVDRYGEVGFSYSKTTVLSEVEQLFGIAGKRAELCIDRIECITPGEKVRFHQNSIDRLTGGTRTGALFVKHAFWQPCFEVHLTISQESSFWDRLLARLASQGIDLGYGSSTGYGFFKVERLKS